MKCFHCPPLRRAEGGVRIGGEVTVLPWCGLDEWPDVVNAVITGGAAPGTYPLTLDTTPGSYWLGWHINDAIDLGSVEGTGVAVVWAPDAFDPVSETVYPILPLFNPDAQLTGRTSIACNPFLLTFDLEGPFVGITMEIVFP